MRTTSLEWVRLVVFVVGELIIFANLVSSYRDWRLMRQIAGPERRLYRVNFINSGLRLLAMTGLLAVAIVAAAFDTVPEFWVAASQATNLGVGVALVLVALLIRMTQRWVEVRGNSDGGDEGR